VHACAAKIASLADVFVCTGLVHAYATAGDMASSARVFDEMPHRNLASWNALLVGYTRSGMHLEALRVFRELTSAGHKLDQVTMSGALSACAGARAENFGRQVHACVVKAGLDTSALCVTNALLDMYTKCDCSQEALALFDAADCRDVFTWNIVILGCIHENRVEKACRMFRSMVRGAILPDDVSFATVLQATACLAAWDLGASLHAAVEKTGFVVSQVVARSLINMYSKSGCLDDARRVFETAQGHLSIMSWTAMITAFQQHGQGRQAINLFEILLKKGIMPDHVTFVSVLSSCSHSGLVELGRKYFGLMTKVYKLAPRSEHYCCMVDMFGRAGLLGDAKQFVDEMPVRPDASVLGALLSACLNCGDLELGKKVAENLFEIEPGKAGNYVLLANIYASHGRLDEAKEVRSWMVSQEVRKEKGCSLVNLENRTVLNASGLPSGKGR
jgi:pentatricopeptide repeat protein